MFLRAFTVFVVHFVLSAVSLFVYIVVTWAAISRLAWLVVISIVAACGAVAYLATRRWAWPLPSAIVLLLTLLLQFVDISPVQPTARALARIRAGMREAEVRQILRQEFPPGSRFRPPGMEAPIRSGVLSFVLDPQDGHYDAAIVEVRFTSGRVTSARFLPD